MQVPVILLAESAKLIQLDVPLASESASNPWVDTFGRSADDPDFDAVVAEIERARSAGIED